MDAINLMMEEHKLILRGLKLFRKLSLVLINKNEIDVEDYEKIIDFVRSFADKHHHNKEEAVLFQKMKDELGDETVKGPLSGMYIEHDFGRLYMKTLSEALQRYISGDADSRVDIIANSICYADLLTRHIDKEDRLIYTFARRALSKEGLNSVDENCQEIEKAAEAMKLQNRYYSIIEELERKYGI